MWGRGPTRAITWTLTALLAVTGVAALAPWIGREPVHVTVGSEGDAGGRAVLKASADAHRGAAERALGLGIGALEREPVLYGGEVWFLQRALEVRPDERLRWRLQRAVKKLAGTREERLVNPTAPLFSLPEDPGRGIMRLAHYLLAPIGAPKVRAVEFISDFLSHDADGYVLTHQLLVLEWARAAGLDLPEEVRQRRRPVLDRMKSEQAGQQVFSDLFVERTALLIAFASPPASDAGRWVDTVLREQRPDGSWHDSKRSVLAFDGQQSWAVHPRGHTTGFAVGALLYFLERY